MCSQQVSQGCRKKSIGAVHMLKTQNFIWEPETASIHYQCHHFGGMLLQAAILDCANLLVNFPLVLVSNNFSIINVYCPIS
jgi:hypothetical protein